MSDEGFTTEIRFRPSYDYRDDPKSDLGAHGMEIILVLQGPAGAIDCRISTGWVARPLAGEYDRRGGQQPRRDKPGVDQGLLHCYPTGSYVGSHAAVQRQDYWTEQDGCPYIEGAVCYGDGSFIAADVVLAAMVVDGSDGAWRQMRAYYDAWLGDAE